jgi:hypothetical protein
MADDSPGDTPATATRNGRLKIDMPFDDAIRAALDVKPKGKVGNGKAAAKPRKKPAKKG